MTVMTTAGTVLGISATVPATFTKTAFEALTFTEIGEITEIGGDVGRVYNVVNHNPISTRATVKMKGSYQSGSLALTIAIDRADAGQVLAQAALNSDAKYSFKMELQDGSILYFQGLVTSFPINPGGVDSVTAGTINVEITSDKDGNDFVEVPAL